MLKFLNSFKSMYLDAHSFFVKETPSFVGRETTTGYTLSIKQKLYYPIAYTTFMYLMISDWFYCYKF